MEEYEIKSRLIMTAGYHGSILFLKTTDGKLYSYNSVPREVFDEFIASNAHDEFYVKRIVPQYSNRRMS